MTLASKLLTVLASPKMFFVLLSSGMALVLIDALFYPKTFFTPFAFIGYPCLILCAISHYLYSYPRSISTQSQSGKLEDEQ